MGGSCWAYYTIPAYDDMPPLSAGGQMWGGNPPMCPLPPRASAGPRPAVTSPFILSCRCNVGICTGLSGGIQWRQWPVRSPPKSRRCASDRMVVSWEPPSIAKRKEHPLRKAYRKSGSGDACTYLGSVDATSGLRHVCTPGTGNGPYCASETVLWKLVTYGGPFQGYSPPGTAPYWHDGE